MLKDKFIAFKRKRMFMFRKCLWGRFKIRTYNSIYVEFLKISSEHGLYK